MHNHKCETLCVSVWMNPVTVWRVEEMPAVWHDISKIIQANNAHSGILPEYWWINSVRRWFSLSILICNVLPDAKLLIDGNVNFCILSHPVVLWEILSVTIRCLRIVWKFMMQKCKLQGKFSKHRHDHVSKYICIHASVNVSGEYICIKLVVVGV